MAESRIDFALDDTLVGRAVGGDRAALVELLEFLGPRVRDRLSIAAVWRGELEADDVMQATYLEVFLRVGQLEADTVGGFRRWLERAAENNLRDAIRGLERACRGDPRKRLVEPDRTASSCVGLLDLLGCHSLTASRDAVRSEAVGRLRAALERLPESYRAVVEGYDLQGRDVADVAAALGRSRGAVWMLRARAHDRLRELLGPGSHLLDSRD